MNYILNTKTKKVEIYWDNNNEYQAIINFLSQCVLTEEKNSYIVKANELLPNTITWNTNNLPNSYTISGNSLEGITGIATITDSTAETAKVSLNNDKFSTYVSDSITASESEQTK